MSDFKTGPCQQGDRERTHVEERVKADGKSPIRLPAQEVNMDSHGFPACKFPFLASLSQFTEFVILPVTRPGQPIDRYTRQMTQETQP
jgi:hypothetical protein